MGGFNMYGYQQQRNFNKVLIDAKIGKN